MYRPHTFYLADETIQVWNYLWNLLQVRLRLYDTEKTMITQAPQPSGLTPSIFTQMVHPPTIYYTPRYRLLLSPEDNKFEGGRLNLNGKRGWYFEFDFQMSREDLKALDDARARLIVDGGPPETMRSIPSPMAAAAAGGGAGPGEAQPAEGGMGGPPAAETGEGAAARGPGAGEVGMGATGAGGSPAGSAAASAAPETVPPAY